MSSETVQSQSRKRKKLSDLTSQDTNTLLNLLTVFKSTLEDLENDEDVPPELLRLLEKLGKKLQVVQHTSFSKVDIFALLAAGIISRPSLTLSEDKRDEIEAAGKADVTNSSLSFDTTVLIINLVRNHISYATEAGCRILINMILLRVVSTMQDQGLHVNIIPEFPIQKTSFDTDAGERTFSGVVDYLLALLPQGSLSKFLLKSPVDALANASAGSMPLTPTIIEAKKDNLIQALPQAAISVASYCKQQKLSGLRGCVTSGEQWMFFGYKGADPAGTAAMMQFADEISLGSQLENLPLVLGLLKDLVQHALDDNQVYFVEAELT